MSLLPEVALALQSTIKAPQLPTKKELQILPTKMAAPLDWRYTIMRKQ